MDWKSMLKQSVSAISSATDAASKKASEGIKYLQSGKGFKGFIAAAVLVITADRKTEEDELDNAVRNIRAYPMFSGYSEVEVLQALRKQIADTKEMTFAMAQRHYLGLVRENVTNQSAQEVLIEFLIDLSLSDGKAHEAEVAAIKQLVTTFGLSEATFPNLASAGAGTLVPGGSAWS